MADVVASNGAPGGRGKHSQLTVGFNPSVKFETSCENQSDMENSHSETGLLSRPRADTDAEKATKRSVKVSGPIIVRNISIYVVEPTRHSLFFYLSCAGVYRYYQPW